MRIDIAFRESAEISGLSYKSHCCIGLYSQQTAEPLDFIIVLLFLSELLDPPVEGLQFVYKIIVCNKILTQGLFIHISKSEASEPLKVLFCPFRCLVCVTVSGAESIDLLLDLLELKQVIIPHADVFLYFIIMLGGNVYGLIPSATQT